MFTRLSSYKLRLKSATIVLISTGDFAGEQIRRYSPSCAHVAPGFSKHNITFVRLAIFNTMQPSLPKQSSAIPDVLHKHKHLSSLSRGSNFSFSSPGTCRSLQYLHQSHPTIAFLIFWYLAHPEHDQVNLSDPLRYQSNRRNRRSSCIRDSSQTVHFQNMLFVHSLTAGGSAESLSCPKLKFQCFVADKRKKTVI